MDATPGKGTNVPLYILGSSLFGARLAAELGLPYAFASHFAPNALQDAVAVYRREFRPSAQLDAPHVIAGVNVIAADTTAEAQEKFLATKRARVVAVLRPRPDVHRRGGGHDPGLARRASTSAQMMKYSAVGTPAEVLDYLDGFTEHADADELIVASTAPDRKAWLRSWNCWPREQSAADAVT